MSNDNPTRILRPNPGQTPADDSSATRITGGKPAAGKGATSNNEPTTRMISGYSDGDNSTSQEPSTSGFELAAGWLVVTEGPGRGCTREIYYGMNSIGRGHEERICLDFGDTAISREAHAYIVFDEKQLDFYIQHGGKSNLVRLNDSPVLAPQPLKRGDSIAIGSTKLMFVPLCGEDFKWEKSEA